MTQSGHDWRSMRPRYRCCKSGVSDRHDRAVRTGQSFNFGVEVLRERLDDPRTETGLWLGKDTVGPAYSIVSNREFPIRAINVLGDVDQAVHLFAGEGML